MKMKIIIKKNENKTKVFLPWLQKKKFSYNETKN